MLLNNYPLTSINLQPSPAFRQLIEIANTFHVKPKWSNQQTTISVQTSSLLPLHFSSACNESSPFWELPPCLPFWFPSSIYLCVSTVTTAVEHIKQVTGGAWKANQSGSKLKSKLSMLLFSVLITPLPSCIREQTLSIQLFLPSNKAWNLKTLASITKNK